VVLFYFGYLINFPKLEKAVINDINSDLINTYRVIASKPKELISILRVLTKRIHNLEGNEDRKKKEYYYKKENCTTQEKKNKTDKPLCLFF
jgi:DNA adenine methylase